MITAKWTKFFIAIVFICKFITPVYANDQIRILGSSTVFPYAQLVSDKFHELYSQFKAPVVESGGTGAGIKEFCLSDADNSIDIANASRPMSESELKTCFTAGVKQVQKIIFGHDGIVLAINKKTGQHWNIRPQDIYKALAARIMINGTLVQNPITKWNEVNKNLPNWKIEAYIPGEKQKNF